MASLLERGVLTDKAPDEELAATAATLAETSGRDPGEMLERFRRARQEGAQPYWATATARGIADLDGRRRRLDAVLLGDCDLQMEAEFLRWRAPGAASICASPRPSPTMRASSPNARTT